MSRTIVLATLAAVTLHLAGCDREAAPKPSPDTSPTVEQGQAAQASTPAIVPASPSPVAAPSQSRDPAEVASAWARMMSSRQWDAAYLYWGDRGARSGMTLQQFRDAWDKVKDPVFSVGPGEQEGAAGSLYYTAPVTLVSGATRKTGAVVFRRVNDVDGATAEQLRWHIESLTIAP